MARLLTVLAHTIRQPALSAMAAAVLALPAISTPTFARGPENIADVAEKVIDAVVNISTSQKVEARGGGGGGGGAGPQATPQLPPGSPFEEFFEEFFKNRRARAAKTRLRTAGLAASIRSARASSSMPPASSSPTIT